MDYKKLMEEKLREAAFLGDLETLNDLISKGVDVNSKNAINGWTALHWAACRGNVEAATILLKNGADKESLTHKQEMPSSLSSSSEIQHLLNGETTQKRELVLPIIPNFLKNPPLFCSKIDSKESNLVNHSENNSDKALILKLETREHQNEFVEIEIPIFELTYKKLKEVCSEECSCHPDNILKIIKLPNTIIRNDKDVQRLADFQEIRVLLKTDN